MSKRSLDPVALATRLSEQRSLWQPLVEYDPSSRYYARLAATRDHEAWLLTWLPGQRRVCGRTDVRTLSTGALRAFGTRHIHASPTRPSSQRSASTCTRRP